MKHMQMSDEEIANTFGFRIFATVFILGLITLLLSIWPLIAYNQKYRRCVQLENGANLGYEAVFDLSRPWWRPIIVPKRPDGTPIVETNVWPIYFTKTTLYGSAWGPTGGEDYEFAWRTDTGTIVKNQNPTAYKTLIAEAGQKDTRFGTGLYDTGAVMFRHLKRLEYQEQWCATRLVTW